MIKAIAGEENTLKNLLVGILDLDARLNCVVTGISIDSRKVKSGDLFLAYHGAVVNGHDFIDDAVDKGAVAVLCEDAISSASSKKIPIVVVPDLKKQIGLIAAKFYGYPSRQLKVIGVTGTNGKTTITQFIASILTNLGVPCGVIGTIGIGFPGKLTPVVNTTPDSVTLHHWLFKLKKEGAQVVVMEVSSHSLVQKRISGIDFNIAVFTNLTRDHLDYHGTMENYGIAKKMLFMQPKLSYAVINADDEFGLKLIKEFKDQLEVYAYTIKDTMVEVPAIEAKDIKLDIHGIIANVITPWGRGTLNSQLLGKFNLSNLMSVLAVLGIMKISLKDALMNIGKLETVNGRMQTFGGDKKPLIIVDYAHTPDALEQVLLALRECCSGALWCIFGCGGDRDKGKRSIMGQISERYSDHIIITSDNPRNEDPEQIVNDILQGLLCPWAAEIELDRRAAIAHAIDCAHANDIIVIVGKGHEDYQIIGKERLPFNDQKVVEKVLNSKRN